MHCADRCRHLTRKQKTNLLTDVTGFVRDPWDAGLRGVLNAPRSAFASCHGSSGLLTIRLLRAVAGAVAVKPATEQTGIIFIQAHCGIAVSGH